jgi:hypothetical protein
VIPIRAYRRAPNEEPVNAPAQQVRREEAK